MARLVKSTDENEEFNKIAKSASDAHKILDDIITHSKDKNVDNLKYSLLDILRKTKDMLDSLKNIKKANGTSEEELEHDDEEIGTTFDGQ